MQSSPHEQPQPATAKPRRDLLGFAKSVVDLFSGVTGFAAAGLGILSSAAAIALADPFPDAQPVRPPADPPANSTPDRAGPLPGTSPQPGIDPGVWAVSVSEQCAGAALEGGMRIAGGDLTGFSAALQTIAAGLRTGPAPIGFETAVASAATDLERAATASAAGDLTAVQLADRASATLVGLGATGC